MNQDSNPVASIMRRLNFRAALLVAGILMSACSTSPPLQSVEDDPRAELIVRKATTTSEFTVFLNLADDHCSLSDLGKVELLGLETEHSAYIRPNRVHVASVMREQGFGGQWKHVAFDVEAGQSYLIEYERVGIDSSSYPAKLIFRINFVNITGGISEPVPLLEFKQCDA